MDLMVQNLDSHVDGTVGLFASPIYRKKLRVKETEWKELNDEIAVNLKLGGGNWNIFPAFQRGSNFFIGFHIGFGEGSAFSRWWIF